MAGPWEKYQRKQPEDGPWTRYNTQGPEAETSAVAGGVDAFGRGIADMVTLGAADEIGAGARWLGGKILPWQENVTYDEALQEVRDSDRKAAEENPISNAAGQVVGAVGGGVGLAKAGLSATARAAKGGAGLGKLSAASALDGAAISALDGFNSGEGLDNRLSEAGEGFVGGGLIGMAMPKAMQVVGSAAKRAISPFLTSPERMNAAAALAKEGVGVTAGQKTGSKGLRYLESELGGGVTEELMEKQGEQFTKAALKKAGIDASRATPEVIDDAFTKIGQQFDDLASRNSLIPDRQLATDLGDTWKEYASLVPETARAPVVMDLIQDVGKRLGQGNLDGAAYQAARSRIDRMARTAGKDPQLSQALYGIRNALDDGMERSIASSNPSDAGAWREARNSYRNLLVLERAATGAGEDAALGIISPAQLRNATVTKQGRRNYARGDGDFAELSRAGEALLKPLPNSGTAGRIRAQNLGAGLMSTIGGITGGTAGGLPGGIAGALAGAAIPKVAGKVLMNPVTQALLGNQVAARLAMSPDRQAILNAMLNMRASEYSDDVGRKLLAP